MTIDFNINYYVRVRLTEFGREIHRNLHAALIEQTPALREHFPYNAPQEDAEGWSRWQMWDLMKIFGAHISMAKAPFETLIKIETP